MSALCASAGSTLAATSGVAACALGVGRRPNSRASSPVRLVAAAASLATAAGVVAPANSPARAASGRSAEKLAPAGRLRQDCTIASGEMEWIQNWRLRMDFLRVHFLRKIH